MRLNFKNTLGVLSLLLFFAVTTSCQKENDLVSSYVIKSSLSILENKNLSNNIEAIQESSIEGLQAKVSK